ncbi:MAG TPA: hypothetical protein VJA44_04905 [Acidimicrobiia bacterium]|nr:hypothetical protein [Acidimicrobiia bacterium]
MLLATHTMLALHRAQHTDRIRAVNHTRGHRSHRVAEDRVLVAMGRTVVAR